MNNIHPLAFVSPKAKLGDNVEVGPFAFIDDDVTIGDGCKIHPMEISYTSKPSLTNMHNSNSLLLMFSQCICNCEKKSGMLSMKNDFSNLHSS